jgi:hypothetical protein
VILIHWIHKVSETDVILIPCEGVHQCRLSENCSALTSQEGAHCGPHHTPGSFLCAACDAGYSKVNGECVECEGVNWGLLGMTLLTSIATGVWMLRGALKVCTIRPLNHSTVQGFVLWC